LGAAGEQEDNEFGVSLPNRGEEFTPIMLANVLSRN
jgi:hypothetical protein